MLIKRLSEDRGHQEHGWLTAKHTFSFANYFDVNHLGFSDLLVINEDLVQPSRGFRTHPHDNMEIFTYILKGALQHKDSMGFSSIIRPGDIQLMSAGTGVQHSEVNASNDEPVHLLQIWIKPNVMDIEPSYQQFTMDKSQSLNQIKLVISPNGEDGSLMIHQNARIYVGQFDEIKNIKLEVNQDRYYYLHLAKGKVIINDLTINEGDGVKITEELALDIHVIAPSEFLLFDLNPKD